jgi:TPR repeat protein
MDETDSIETLRARAEAGDAEAQSDLGSRLARLGSRAEAEQWFRRAAEQGLARAKHNLGVLYWHGEDSDTEEALNWFRAAAKAGWLPSIFVLGMLVERGGNIENAIKLYQIAAQGGLADAQDALSRLHFNRETEKDYEIARKWAEAAAEQGHALAIARLGTIYHEGCGVQRDPKRASAYFLEAANLGHDGAQLMAGAGMHLGIGVPVDRIEAAHWLLRSAQQGNEGAQAYLEGKAGMADLTKQELEEAQRRAQQPLPWTKPAVS